MSHVLLTDGRKAWSVGRISGQSKQQRRKAKGGKSIWGWTVGRVHEFPRFYENSG